MRDVQPITITIGGPDDPWLEEKRGVFPSTTSYKAERYYAKHGRPMPLRTVGHDVIRFIEENCVLTNGRFLGLPFRLLAWQKRYLLELYEVVDDTEHEGFDWIYKHRWSLLGVPKKNGKSELIAGQGLYHTIEDPQEPAPEVLCAAASAGQADKIFDPAKVMCRHPNGNLNGWLKVLLGSIEGRGMPGKFIRVAAAAGTNDGANPSKTFLDEVHEWVKPKHREVFTILTGGSGARRGAMNLMITTAGSEEEAIWYEWYSRGLDVREGITKDPTFYFCWFEAPAGMDHRDPEAWFIANPSYGHIQKPSFYEDMLTKRTESEFRRYYLNQLTENDEVWEAAELWPALAGRVPKFRPDLPTFVGIDVGRKHDSCAVAAVQYREDLGKFIVKQRIWKNPHLRRSKRYSSWKMDMTKVENWCRRLYERCPEPSAEDSDGYMREGPIYVYDPHFFARSADMLEEEGLHMDEFPQSDTRMTAASQRLFEVIKGGEILHNGNEAATRQMRSVQVKEKDRGWKISKPRGSSKCIDYPQALAMAVKLCSDSLHEDEGGIGLW